MFTFDMHKNELEGWLYENGEGKVMNICFCSWLTWMTFNIGYTVDMVMLKL